MLGISQSALAAFETGRNAIRWEIGLRICRHLIVNEEWFATGRIPILEAAMRAKKYDDATIKSPVVQRYLQGTCVDLGAENEALGVPQKMLLVDAFKSLLLPAYKRLVPIWTHMPRLVLKHSDSHELMANYIRRLHLIHLGMLDNEAMRKGKDNSLAARDFTKATLAAGIILSKRFMGVPTPEIRESQFNFLRAIANDETAPIGPLFPAEDAFPAEKK